MTARLRPPYAAGWTRAREAAEARWRGAASPASDLDDAQARAAAWAAWMALAHPAQRPPPGAWATWLFLGGRGAGKTRAGAEWLQAQAAPGARLAILGPTLHEVRAVMVEG